MEKYPDLYIEHKRKMWMEMKRESQDLLNVSLVVITRNDGKILGVARFNDRNEFGFPGGKLEPNETFLDAAIREVYEETRVLVDGLRVVHAGFSFDGNFVVTFFANSYDDSDIVEYTKEGIVEWVDPSVFLSSIFYDYNEIVLKKIGSI